MISCKVKGIILAVILSLASIMMPFSVYAETIDSHIRGRNYTYEPITYNDIQVSTNTYYENIGVIHITFELDDEYIGYVLPNYTIQYDNYFYGASTPNWGTLSKTFDRRIFVNGSSFSFDISVNWNSISINTAPGGDPFNYDSYTITSSDVIKYADIDSLDQIINILQDNQDIITDIYDELQTVVSNTSLANTYLDSLMKIRNWNVPIYSYGFIYSCYRRNYTLYEDNYFKLTYFDWPIFKTVANQNSLSSVYCNKDAHLTLIFGVSGNYGQSSINNFMNIVGYTDQNSLTYTSQQIIFDNYLNIPLFKIFKFDITSSIGQNVLFKVIADNELFIPIYFGLSDANFDTDFALTFGLSNRLLDNLDIIANGTTSSNSAASDLNDASSDYSSIADDVVNVESGLTTNFETEVNKIDLNTGLNVFGGNFMTSATWVRTQFDRLTENTPYGSLVVYGLTLGFALLMLGKVFL